MLLSGSVWVLCGEATRAGFNIAQQQKAHEACAGVSFVLMHSAASSRLGQVFGWGVLLADVLDRVDVCLIVCCHGEQSCAPMQAVLGRTGDIAVHHCQHRKGVAVGADWCCRICHMLASVTRLLSEARLVQAACECFHPFLLDELCRICHMLASSTGVCAQGSIPQSAPTDPLLHISAASPFPSCSLTS